MSGLEKLFREWQRALGLRDWTLKFAIRSQMEMGGDHGRVNVYEKKRCAFICLLDPSEADSSEVEPYDPEIAIVHEQLHCSLHAFSGPDGSLEDVCQEQAIHAISKLLVSQQRQIRSLEARLKRAKQPYVAEARPIAA